MQTACAGVFFALLAALAARRAIAADAPIPIKVVVVSMFENGKPTGDEPGEFQFWIERQKLNRELPFPLGRISALSRTTPGLLAICTGGGITNASTSIMALGMDPRFDLSKAYWVIAGIAGGDPEDVSLGTAAWARHVVDGDLLYEIDAREMPKDWPYGLLPLGAKKPNDKADGWTVDTIAVSAQCAARRVGLCADEGSPDCRQRGNGGVSQAVRRLSRMRRSHRSSPSATASLPASTGTA